MAQSRASHGAPQPGGTPFHDYAPRHKAGLLRSPRVAALVLAASVLFGTLYGSHRSLRAVRPEISDSRIVQVLDMRCAVALNLTTLAGNYPVNPDLVGKTRDVAVMLQDERQPDGVLRDLNATLDALTGELLDALEAQELTERDALYANGFRADLAGLSDQLARDDYHARAVEFNRMLQSEFPANVLGPLTGVSPATLF